jgi:glycosyltransferase involved in cell wall biosynthesis
MKIAIVSYYNAFDYWGIGGTESLTRRLAHGFVEEGDRVDFLFYGWQGPQLPQPSHPCIMLYYFNKFTELLDFIKTSDFDHLITGYIRREDRLRYTLFRRAFRKKIHFHMLHLGWHPKAWGRILRLFEICLAPYNGFIFTVSPRLYKEALRCTKRVIQVWPPVPDNYFLSPEVKATKNGLQVCFIGRLDPGKGFYEALDILRYFQQYFGATCLIYGLYSENVSDTMTLHQRLLDTPEVTYIPMKREAYSEGIEDRMREVLRQTDILVLPYRTLSSSIDTPLLILEGMASLCGIVNPGQEHILEIYGESPFLLTGNLEVWKTQLQNMNLSKLIQKERTRLWLRNQKLNFRSSSVVRSMRKVLMNG